MRGKNNLEIVNDELQSITENMLQSQKKDNTSSNQGSKQIIRYFTALRDPTFLKPFGMLLVLFPYALNWTGGSAVQFYFVSILR